MPILVMCSNAACGELFDVSDEQAGLQVSCPSCGAVQTAGAAPAAPKVAPQQPPAAQTPAISVAPTPVATPAASSAQSRVAAPPPPVSAPAPASVPAPEPEAVDLPSVPAPRRAKAASSPTVPDGDLGLAPIEEDSAEVAAAKREDLKAKITASELSAGEPATIETQPEPPQEQPSFSDKFDQLAESAVRSAAPPPEEEVFSHGVAGAAVLGAGTLGMIGGLIVGIAQSPPGGAIVGAYVGAAIGWIAGFMVAFLFAFSGQRDSGKVRCQSCGSTFPAETEVCGWCGAPIEPQSLSPLASDSLNAFSYARRGTWSIAWTTIIAVAAGLMWLGCQYAVNSAPGAAAWLVAGVSAAIGVAIAGYVLEFFWSTIDQSIHEPDKAPSYGAFGPRSLLMATRAIGIVVVYVLPVVTLPLLPAGLMLIGTHGLSEAMGVRRAIEIVRRRPHDYAVLWLMTLLWVGAMTLAITLVALGNSFLLNLLPADPQAAQVLSAIDFCLITAIVSAIAATFGLAIFRCIGSFARHNRG